MKHVLITGGSGVIGSALIPLFLDEPETRVHLILRAQSGRHLDQRLAKLKQHWQMERDQDDRLKRIHAYRGDVLQPGLGLQDAVRDRLINQLTHVVHCAGDVKLNQPIQQARASAVNSARHIVTLVRTCRQSGPFQKLDVVSTVGVAGRTAGLIPEQRLSAARQFRNTYEAAKAEAEDYLWREIDFGLPATIHRPSMVVGDSASGKILKFQVFYYLCEYLTGRKTFGFLPDMGHVRLDLVPVNWVAQAICLSSRSTETVGQVFHLCSGPEDSLELKELTRQVRRIYIKRGHELPALRQLSRRQLSRIISLLSRLSFGRTRRTLKSLPHLLAYLDQEQTFGTDQTRKFLSRQSCELPSIEEFLPVVVDSWLSLRERGADSHARRSSVTRNRRKRVASPQQTQSFRSFAPAPIGPRSEDTTDST